jgi:hypothetical protein
LFWPNSNKRNIKENSIKHSPFLVSRGRDFRTDAWRILTVQPHLVMKYKAVQQKQWMMFSCLENLGLKPWSLYLNLAEVSFPIIHFWENRISSDTICNVFLCHEAQSCGRSGDPGV